MGSTGGDAVGRFSGGACREEVLTNESKNEAAAHIPCSLKVPRRETCGASEMQKEASFPGGFATHFTARTSTTAPRPPLAMTR